MPRPLPSAADLTGSPLLDRLHSHGGAAPHGLLVRDDAERNALRNLVRTGLVRRVARATYAVPGTPTALTHAARFGGHVDCLSAALLHEVPLLRDPTTTHLALPRGRGTSRRGADELARVTVHRSGTIAWSPDVAGPVQPVAQALARMLVCCPRDEAVVAIDGALHARMTDVAAIAAVLPRTAPLRCRTALGLADGRADSVIETLARLALLDAGFVPLLQVAHRGVGRVDLQVGRVIIECDGFEYHSDRVAYRQDRRRDRILHARGFVVLRFTYEDVIQDPTSVVRALEAVLAGASGR